MVTFGTNQVVHFVVQSKSLHSHQTLEEESRVKDTELVVGASKAPPTRPEEDQAPRLEVPQGEVVLGEAQMRFGAPLEEVGEPSREPDWPVGGRLQRFASAWRNEGKKFAYTPLPN